MGEMKEVEGKGDGVFVMTNWIYDIWFGPSKGVKRQLHSNATKSLVVVINKFFGFCLSSN